MHVNTCTSFIIGLIVLSSGCATTTGIPSHGGGKRFFIEQELISASARAAAQCISIDELAGKRCALYVTSVGDQGGGNLVGGKYQWQALVRGDYVSRAPTTNRNINSNGDALTITRDGGGALQQTIESSSPLIFPSVSESQQEGFAGEAGAGFGYNGNGEYNALGFLNDDTSFLGAILRESLVLKGILLTTPNEADYYIYVTVDAYGTNRSRTEWHLFNQERLRAKTALHISAFDRKGQVVVPTHTSCWEADYRERYVLWCGPFEVEKRAYQSDDLLVSFRGLSDMAIGRPAPQDTTDDDDARIGSEGLDLPAPEPGSSRFGTRPSDATRPGDLLQPLTQPDPTRPEDVNPPE